MKTQEELDLIQRQLMELVIDIQIHRSKRLIVDYDVNNQTGALYVFILGREAPFLRYSHDADWHMDFDLKYNSDKNEKMINDCLTSLACVLSDLEAGV